MEELDDIKDFHNKEKKNRYKENGNKDRRKKENGMKIQKNVS